MQPAATIPSIDAAAALATPGAHVIDLRSPSEYAEDHLPGAVNHPLFKDAERELIGTLYKQVSPEAAYEKAALLVDEGVGELVRGIAKTVGRPQPEGEVEAVARAITGEGFGAITRGVELTPAEELPERPVIVHCWRAGLRSLSVAVLLRGLGWDEVLILEGGYKAYRRHVIDSLEEATLPQGFVLRGLTGVGKTLVLRELERIRPGWTLDLEGHAKHRSSILGMVGLEPVGQKVFEGDIAKRLRAGFPADLVVYEGESRKVGDIILPERVWSSLQGACDLELTAPLARRVEVLIEDYLAHSGNRDELESRLPFIENRLGPRKWGGVLVALLREEREEELVRILLEEYYDPLYRHSEKRHAERKNGADREYARSFDTSDPRACARAIAEFIDSDASVDS